VHAIPCKDHAKIDDRSRMILKRSAVAAYIDQPDRAH